jgi:hypothetical protein
VSLAISRGQRSPIIAQIRLSSEYLWSCETVCDAIVETILLLYVLFGECLWVQVSEKDSSPDYPFFCVLSEKGVEPMEEHINLVGYGVDTLIINVRYSDSKGQPVKQELDEKLAQELDYLQGEARRVEAAVATDWAFQDVLLFVEPHGAGKQWRWLLTSRLLHIAVSRGKFNDIIAQVGFSSEYLWSQAWCGDALYKVHIFLMSIFGEYIHLQLSEVHLCVDVVGYDIRTIQAT